jgi:putative membrane protein
MRSLKENLVLFAKGVGMGSADIVPGVSGGTIAFITGIYAELLDAIRSFDVTALRLLFSLRLKAFWQHINGSFLVVLLAGILFAIVALSRIVLYLLNNHPELLWSFFFGLIVASAFVVGRKIDRWSLGVVLAGVIGAGIAYFITVASPTQTPETYWFVFLSGAIAICAMILPGVSGSFLLVLLAKYEYILGAVRDLQAGVIAAFALGCVTGIMLFSRVLHYMLEKHYNLTVALLSGFMIGSLNKVWPWKITLQTITDRHGVEKPVVQQNVLPNDYLELTGQEPYLLYAILLALFGFVLVWLVDRYAAEPVAEEREKELEIRN